MKPEELKEELLKLYEYDDVYETYDAIASGKMQSDKEIAHIKADKLLSKTLRSLGYHEAMDIYDNIEAWYA